MAEEHLLIANNPELIPPAEASAEFDPRAVHRRAECAAIQRTLAHTQGLLSVAVRLLGIGRFMLYSLMDTYGLATIKEAFTTTQE